MREKNLSQWFLLSEQTPWEVGVYEVQPSSLYNSQYSYWDGARFNFISSTRDGALGYYLIGHRGCDGEKVCKWRGMSYGLHTNPEKPKKAAKPRNKRKQFIVVMEASGDNLQILHPVGVFEDEKNADAFLEIHQKRCPKWFYYKTWTPRFCTPE